MALSRDLGVSHESAFVMASSLSEIMAEEMKGRIVGGEGKEAEIDGAYFGGDGKPANHEADRRDRRLLPSWGLTPTATMASPHLQRRPHSSA